MVNEKGQRNSKEKRRTHRSDRAREAGFSVIELVLVMILVGIIAAITIPRFLPAGHLLVQLLQPLSCSLRSRGSLLFRGKQVYLVCVKVA